MTVPSCVIIISNYIIIRRTSDNIRRELPPPLFLNTADEKRIKTGGKFTRPSLRLAGTIITSDNNGTFCCLIRRGKLGPFSTRMTPRFTDFDAGWAPVLISIKSSPETA